MEYDGETTSAIEAAINPLISRAGVVALLIRPNGHHHQNVVSGKRKIIRCIPYAKRTCNQHRSGSNFICSSSGFRHSKAESFSVVQDVFGNSDWEDFQIDRSDIEMAPSHWLCWFLLCCKRQHSPPLL